MTKPDWQTLMGVPAFQDFLWWLIQNGKLFEYRDTEADGRNLFAEGRRSLALDVLGELERSQPAPAPDGIPAMTLIQTFRHQAQSTAIKPEKPVGRRNDQYRDLNDSGDADG